MKKSFVLATFVLSFFACATQKKAVADTIDFIRLNQQIDTYVVHKNVAALDTLYAPDFVFSHGTGMIEGKTSWLSAVKQNSYAARNHDSVTVELHPDLAIVRGKLSIERMDKSGATKYNLKYVRAFATRNNKWQMVSHITTHEQHQQ